MLHTRAVCGCDHYNAPCGSFFELGLQTSIIFFPTSIRLRPVFEAAEVSNGLFATQGYSQCHRQV